MLQHPAQQIDKESSTNYTNEKNFQFVQFDKLDDKKHRMIVISDPASP